MAYRSKIISRKIIKQEQELHILANPLSNPQSPLITSDDYQAPLTTHTLSPYSKWIIVRNNIHKIRSWGGLDLDRIDPVCQDWYIFYQMRRELRRAQSYIRQIEHQPDFVPVHYFDMPTDQTHTQRYNVSRVRPSAALYYPRFGPDSLPLQSLLYYFSKECAVPYNSVFRPFLSGVCSVIYQERAHDKRVAALRRAALVVTVIVGVIMGLMFFSLIISVFTTTSNLKRMYKNDPDGRLEWPRSGTTLNYL
jgi:hypothetical protein